MRLNMCVHIYIYMDISFWDHGLGLKVVGPFINPKP